MPANEEEWEEGRREVDDEIPPIKIDTAPHFHLGRLLDRVELLVALLAGTFTLLTVFTTLSVSSVMGASLTIAALGDLVIRQLDERLFS